MTQEEKDLLLKDICGRIPYNTRLKAFDVPDHDFYLYSISSTDIAVQSILETIYKLLRNMTNNKIAFKSHETRRKRKYYTKLLYTANEIYRNPDYNPGKYIKIIVQEDVD